MSSHAQPVQNLRPAGGGSVRWYDDGPCVVLVVASVDTSVPCESGGNGQEHISHPHQLSSFNNTFTYYLNVSA